jgi:citrate lyase beta subunit
MYVPGSEQHKLEKAASLGIDGVILDLEDGVAFNRKDEARGIIRQALESINYGRTERLVRINPVSSGRAEADLQAVLPGRPDGVVIPKADSAQIVHTVDEIITRTEKEQGWKEGGIALALLIETAIAFIHLAEICQASRRTQVLIFGAEDLCADTGIIRTVEARELLYARSALVMNAAAFGLQAIDMVQIHYRDIDLLEKECQEALELGFSGKTVVHPSQIETVQRIFTPDENQVSYARRVVEGARDAQIAGSGVFTLDGKLVDLPVVKRAESILARARAAGITIPD